MDEQQHNAYSSKYLCRLLVEYRKPILIILAVAALCAVIGYILYLGFLKNAVQMLKK